MNLAMVIGPTVEIALKLAAVVAIVGTISSTIFLILTLVAALRYRKLAARGRAEALATPFSSLPPVTILKPIHGMEDELEENLASFFEQDYPDYEIIFGARDRLNPALEVAERVRARYPNVKSRVVLSGPPTWPNAKVFSLQKMIAATDRSYFVISDSDVRVGKDFLRNTIPPLLDPKVGLVTCMYRGIPATDFWSTLEALGLVGGDVVGRYGGRHVGGDAVCARSGNDGQTGRDRCNRRNCCNR